MPPLNIAQSYHNINQVSFLLIHIVLLCIVTEDELAAMETAIPTYARKIQDKIDGLERTYRMTQFKKWLDSGKVVCRESYALPPVITRVPESK